MTLWETLNGSFQQHSLAWLLASSLLGGIAGAVIKFSFESVLGPGYREWSERRAALRRHSDPLLRAADVLSHRVENMLKHADRGWFDGDDYYRQSTLYVLGRYLAVARLLEREAYLDLEGSTRRAKRLALVFQGVLNSLSRRDCFKNVPPADMSDGDLYDATILRHALTAVAELMVRKNADGTEGREVIGFVEFSQLYESDPRYRKWFGLVERALTGMRSGPHDAKWNRVVVFAIALRLLVCHLDPHRRRTTAREFPYLEQAHPDVREYLDGLIRASGYESILFGREDDGERPHTASAAPRPA